MHLHVWWKTLSLLCSHVLLVVSVDHAGFSTSKNIFFCKSCIQNFCFGNLCHPTVVFSIVHKYIMFPVSITCITGLTTTCFVVLLYFCHNYVYIMFYVHDNYPCRSNTSASWHQFPVTATGADYWPLKLCKIREIKDPRKFSTIPSHLSPPHMHPSPTPGTIECSGANLVEQAENCHFQRSTREMCGAPAILILQGFNISEGDGHTGICECAYRGGRYVCTTGEWVPC